MWQWLLGMLGGSGDSWKQHTGGHGEYQPVSPTTVAGVDVFAEKGTGSTAENDPYSFGYEEVMPSAGERLGARKPSIEERQLANNFVSQFSKAPELPAMNLNIPELAQAQSGKRRQLATSLKDLLGYGG